MAGTTIQLFTKRPFDFSSADGSVVAIRSLDVSSWTEGVLQVRVHANTLTAGTISVKAYPISNTPEEPSVDYLGAVSATASVASSGTPAGTLVSDGLAADFGGALQITVEGATSPNGVATLSAVLVMKS